MPEDAPRATAGGGSGEAPASAADVDVVTPGGRRRIPAHSSVLASASPVLESILQRRMQKVGDGGKVGRAVVRIRGVTDDVAAAFVRLLYAGRSGEEEMEKYAEQMLALAHAYRVGWLKRWCQEAMGARLTPATVVDVMQLAGLCDAPQLHLRCMKLLGKQFSAVERTEAWRFLRDNDPWQELDVLRHLHGADMRRRRWRRKRSEQRVYMELSEAVDCLRHICTEGCTEVWPAGQAPSSKSPCPAYATCRGLQFLLRHFSRCHARATCRRCHRMWQLLRLHAALCGRPDGQCDTPLCAQFKRREQQKVAAAAAADDGDGVGDGKWGLLVKKVKAVRAMSCLAERSPCRC